MPRYRSISLTSHRVISPRSSGTERHSSTSLGCHGMHLALSSPFKHVTSDHWKYFVSIPPMAQQLQSGVTKMTAGSNSSLAHPLEPAPTRSSPPPIATEHV